jgi:hypothetical protein
MSRIADFYSGKIVHPKRFGIEAIWQWNDGQLEFEHTYIQWLFPLVERSKSEPDSPILKDSDIEGFNGSDELKTKLAKSLELMLRFYGFRLVHKPNIEKPIIEPSEKFDERAMRWLNSNNHNYLRITRILKSLTLLGLSAEALEFFAALQRIYIQHEIKIGSYTYGYWKKAVGK